MTYNDKKLALEKVLGSKATIETKVKKVCAIILDGSPNKGEVGEFFFLLHHGVLVEWLKEPLANRVRYVLTQKLKHQRLVRLTEMTPVLNVPEHLADARKAYSDAGKAYGETWKAYIEARKVYNEARKAYNEAWDAVDWTPIHKAQVPETTWNGETIEGVPA